MNEETRKLIDSLAQKLGTTSEYLWKVLLKQAPIDSIIGMGYTLFVLIMGLILWKVHCKLLQAPPQDTGYQRDNYYEDREGITTIMIVLGVIWSICFIITVCCIGSIFTGFYNPEYWALDKILSSMRP